MSNEPLQEAADAAQETHSLEDQIEQLKGELEQARAQSLLERADLDNQRKRLERDVQNARRFANKQLLAELVPVFDSLEAALANAPEGDPVREGAALTLRELLRVCSNAGLVEVAPAPGDAFDPERHQAMSTIDADDVPPGTVARLFQKGYVLSEQLLRPALVVVARQD